MKRPSGGLSANLDERRGDAGPAPTPTWSIVATPAHPPPCPRPHPPSSCCHGAPGAPGAALATPLPTPTAPKPIAPVIITAAPMVLRTIMQTPLVDCCRRQRLRFAQTSPGTSDTEVNQDFKDRYSRLPLAPKISVSLSRGRSNPLLANRIDDCLPTKLISNL